MTVRHIQLILTKPERWSLEKKTYFFPIFSWDYSAGGKENLLLAPVSIRKKTGKNLSRNCSNDESNDARNPVINHAEESYPGVSLYDRADKAQSCEYRVRYVHFTIPILVHDVYIRYTEFVISIEDNFTLLERFSEST